MKTVGERIRQAREHRGLSAEALALRVGYKTQSGISNLENRATGRGGFMLHKIAEALDFSTGWFLEGPDTNDLSGVPPYHQKYTTDTNPARKIQEAPTRPYNARQAAHVLVDSLSEAGLVHAMELLEALADRHPRSPEERAGLPIPAQTRNVA